MTFQKTVLQNGITIITEYMPSVRSVSLGLWFNVGSRDEKPQQLGLAHFMEHMMFKGTPTRSPLDISMHFDKLGAEFNAFTSKEYTCYYARVVDSKLNSALEVLADMLCNSTFSDDAISTEREVVLEEIARSEDTPDDYIFELFSQSMMPSHQLGLPVLGSRTLVSGYTHEDCITFHKAHYTTGNLCIAAAGNVDHETLVKLAEENFSSMTQKQRTARNLHPVVYQGGLFAEKRDIEQSHIVLGYPSLPLGDSRRFALGVLTSILGGSMSARLFQEVREKRGLAYSIYATQGTYQGAGQWCVYAGTRPDNITEVVSLIKQELQSITEGKLNKEELERNIDLICGQSVLSFETTSSHMMRLGKREVLGAEQLSIDELIERFKQVKVEDVVSLSQEIFSKEPTLAIVSPLDKEEIVL